MLIKLQHKFYSHTYCIFEPCFKFIRKNCFKLNLDHRKLLKEILTPELILQKYFLKVVPKFQFEKLDNCFGSLHPMVL